MIGVCLQAGTGNSATGVAIASVANPSFGSVAAVDSRSQSVDSDSEAGVDPLSGYSLPARQEPEIATISSSFPSQNPRSFTSSITMKRFCFSYSARVYGKSQNYGGCLRTPPLGIGTWLIPRKTPLPNDFSRSGSNGVSVLTKIR